MYFMGLLPIEAGSIIEYNLRAYKKTKPSDSQGGIPVKKPKPVKKRKTTTRRRKKPTTVLGGGGLLDEGGIL